MLDERDPATKVPATKAPIAKAPAAESAPAAPPTLPGAGRKGDPLRLVPTRALDEDAVLDAVEPSEEDRAATEAAFLEEERELIAAGEEPREAKRRRLCIVSGKETPRRDLYPVAMLRPALVNRLKAEVGDLPADARISRKQLDRLRRRYVQDLLRAERGELTTLEQEVVASLAEHETLAENVEEEFEEHRTVGEKMSDALASFGGSWAFLISFGAVLFGWMALNVALRPYGQAFDEYPFILLNLVLSTLAAVQAPIIMMSQRRTEAKDRLRSLNDYQVNLKAELEIRHLHEKMDHLLNRQWERLTEIQAVQLEQLQELAKGAGKGTARRKRARLKKAPPAPAPAPAEKAAGPVPSGAA